MTTVEDAVHVCGDKQPVLVPQPEGIPGLAWHHVVVVTDFRTLLGYYFCGKSIFVRDPSMY